MLPADDTIRLACLHHEANRLDEAEALYLQGLARHPRDPVALHGLGLLCHQRGRHGEGAALVGRALAFAPLEPLFHFNLSVGLRHLGRGAEAERAVRTAILLEPSAAHLWHGLALARIARGDRAGALAPALRAVQAAPDHTDALMSLGETARMVEDRPLAAAAYARVVALAPQHIYMLFNLGTVLKEAGQLEAAGRAFRHAVRLRPDFGHACFGAGDVALRSGHEAEAAGWLRRAILLEPGHFDVLSALGRWAERGDAPEESLPWFHRAACVRPGDAAARFNVGMVLERLGRVDEAITAFDAAIAVDPGFAPAHERVALKLSNALWDDYDNDVARVRRLVMERGGSMLPIPFIYMPTTPVEQLACARAYCAAITAAVTAPGAPRLPAAPVRTHDQPITVGYLSGDFRDHAVAYLVAELLERHDRGRFRILGYATGPGHGQPMRRRLEAAVDAMTDLPADLPAFAAAGRIRADGVDILVDLSGHTRYARTDVLALRPAPVQVNYLGYPGTLGGDFVDYIITDAFCVPADQQPFYTERLVHLPDAYQANDSTKSASPALTRAAYGLPEAGVVFCCFNNVAKITPSVFAIWMRLLRRVPGAVLWLLVYTPAVMERLRRVAVAHGVAPDRLVPAPMISQADHLARYAVADLFLDTFPYTAHTTGSDALWMGCPVVTRVGNTFPSRVAGSLLHAFALPDLITETPEAYEALALSLALNPDRLGALRERLTTLRATCRLYDTPRFARHLEQAYRIMWSRHRAGDAPRPFRVESLPL